MNNILLPKIWIGPMSINIVDSIIDVNNQVNIGIIPSRRQIDYNSGYVNNWTTNDFCSYVKAKNKNIILKRDHAGANQGQFEIDDEYQSLYNDSKNFDLIHLDPWKKFKSINSAAQKTIEYIKFCLNINDKILFEVGTEEGIRKYSDKELYKFLLILKKNLSNNEWDHIKYCVIQCGTKLLENKNILNFNKKQLIDMLYVVKYFNLLSKEHNGDYQNINTIKQKFKLGLDSINIAPEFGTFETSIILKYLSKKYFENLFDLCLSSNKWKKWVEKSFNPYNNKKQLILLCCHYLFSNEDFKKIKLTISEIDVTIKNSLKHKLALYDI